VLKSNYCKHMVKWIEIECLNHMCCTFFLVQPASQMSNAHRARQDPGACHTAAMHCQLAKKMGRLQPGAGGQPLHSSNSRMIREVIREGKYDGTCFPREKTEGGGYLYVRPP
jgi:hypothetical protein